MFLIVTRKLPGKMVKCAVNVDTLLWVQPDIDDNGAVIMTMNGPEIRTVQNFAAIVSCLPDDVEVKD